MQVRGFTIIELLVVLTVLAILASAALPLAELTVKRSKERELKASLREIRAAIDSYKKSVDDGRIAVGRTDSGYPPSLEILVNGVEDAKVPGRKQYFLRRIPRDPMSDTNVPSATTWGLRSFDSEPDRPRAGADVYDVFSKSPAKGLDGSALSTW